MMCPYQLIWITLILLSNLLFAPIAIAQPAHHHPPAKTTSPNPEAIAFAKGMDQSMSTMMLDMHSAAVTGDPDLDFLAMMIPHHQGAIDMARLVLLHGNDPLVRQLAQDMIANQQAEIITMKGRFSVLQQGDDTDPDGFPSISGTRGSAEKLTQH